MEELSESTEHASLDEVMGEARQAIKAGMASYACRLLSEHEDRAQDHPPFLTLFGAACCMAGKPEQGTAALERSLQLAPSATAHYNLGEAYEAAGRIREAEQCFRDALLLDPGYEHARTALAKIAASDGAAEFEGEDNARGGAGRFAAADGGFGPAAVAPPFKPSGPRTPEQIAIAQWEEEESLRKRKIEYIRTGIAYGAITGAIMAFVTLIFLNIVASVSAMLWGGETASTAAFLLSLVVWALGGALFGSVVGLVVAWLDGGTSEGLVTGGLVPVLLVQVAGRIGGAESGIVITLTIVLGIVGTMAGGVLGWAIAMSIRD